MRKSTPESPRTTSPALELLRLRQLLGLLDKIIQHAIHSPSDDERAATLRLIKEELRKRVAA
jgi:hypothetical protein